MWKLRWKHHQNRAATKGSSTNASAAKAHCTVNSRPGTRWSTKDGSILCINMSGWWLTYPSEKYERQLGLLFPIYGYGSIPINTIFSGMNIHLPAIPGVQGFDTLPYEKIKVMFQTTNQMLWVGYPLVPTPPLSANRSPLRGYWANICLGRSLAMPPRTDMRSHFAQ